MDEVARMEAVQYMLDTDGWPVIEKFIRERIEDHKNQLLRCPVEEITKHRERVEAFNSVLLYVRQVIDEGREALMEQPP